MRRRTSARFFVVDGENRVLLFRFLHTEGALAGFAFWATPGGGVEAGETLEEAAARELCEETGLELEPDATSVARREAVMQLPGGDRVISDEWYFLVRLGDRAISQEVWTADERRVITAQRWSTRAELETTRETVFPENLAALLATAL